MIRINLDMDMPKECHECPFQLKFKDDEVDTWYIRRCVIMQRKIEYPRPGWCPLEYVSEGQADRESEIIRCKNCKHYDEERGTCAKNHAHGNAETWFCADGKEKE